MSGGCAPTAPADVRHPAKFNADILAVIEKRLTMEAIRQRRPLDILDPFAGVGLIHALRRPMWQTHAIEIEPEWAKQSELRGPTWCMDFFDFPVTGTHAVAPRGIFPDGRILPLTDDWPIRFDVIVTSPTYGNRMADHHQPSPEDTSRRNTYRHALGRPLTAGSSASLQWGPEYRDFHARAWEKVRDLLVPGGLFLLNVKDHIRQQIVQPVARWHEVLCTRVLGFELEDDEKVPVRGLREGANHDVRVDHEHVFVLRKP